jgi:adenylosuccinate lyase
VRALSTEPARFQSWLDVEEALAGRRASWAFIPEAAGQDIDHKAHVKYLDRGDRGLTDGGGRTWQGA